MTRGRQRFFKQDKSLPTEWWIVTAIRPSPSVCLNAPLPPGQGKLPGEEEVSGVRPSTKGVAPRTCEELEQIRSKSTEQPPGKGTSSLTRHLPEAQQTRRDHGKVAWLPSERTSKTKFTAGDCQKGRSERGFPRKTWGDGGSDPSGGRRRWHNFGKQSGSRAECCWQRLVKAQRGKPSARPVSSLRPTNGDSPLVGF